EQRERDDHRGDRCDEQLDEGETRFAAKRRLRRVGDVRHGHVLPSSTSGLVPPSKSSTVVPEVVLRFSTLFLTRYFVPLFVKSAQTVYFPNGRPGRSSDPFAVVMVPASFIL